MVNFLIKSPKKINKNLYNPKINRPKVYYGLERNINFVIIVLTVTKNQILKKNINKRLKQKPCGIPFNENLL